MPAPYNYTIDVPDPTQTFYKSLESAAVMRARQLAMAKQEQDIQMNTLKMAQQAQMQQDLKGLQQDPSPQAITKMMLRYPQLADQLKAPLASLDTRQKDAQFQALLPVYTAVLSGNPDVAASRVEQMAAAAENAGLSGDATKYRSLLTDLRNNPSRGGALLGSYLAAVNPDKFATAAPAIQKIDADARLQRANEQIKAAEAAIKEIELTAKPGEIASQQALRAAQASRANAEVAKLSAEKGAKVQRSTPLPDGSGVQLVLDNGDIIVKTSGNEVISGKAADEFVTKATQAGIDIQGARAGARQTGTEVAKEDAAIVDLARKSGEEMTRLNDTIDFIRNSNAITGPYARELTDLARLKTALGSKAAKGQVTDSDLLSAMLGADVFGMIQSLGVGARGLDTPAEREYMLKVLTGDLPMTKETLIGLTERRKAIYERAINKYNSMLDKGELDRYFKATRRVKERIAVPGATDTFTTPDNKTYSRPAAFSDEQWTAYKQSQGAR